LVPDLEIWRAGKGKEDSHWGYGKQFPINVRKKRRGSNEHKMGETKDVRLNHKKSIHRKRGGITGN